MVEFGLQTLTCFTSCKLQLCNTQSVIQSLYIPEPITNVGKLDKPFEHFQFKLLDRKRENATEIILILKRKGVLCEQRWSLKL